MLDNPFTKVSVAIITFNHEQFITQAIESVLIQETNFDYEIIIGDDYSTDKTREILDYYQNKYPNKITTLLWDKNLGFWGKNNLIRTLQRCQGQYIALLEGDDYWTDPHKLQKQSDFLDSHSDCSICFHGVLKIFENDIHPPINLRYPNNERFTIKNLLIGNFIPTCSAVFRNGLIKEFPDWFYKVQTTDRYLHILNAQYGDIGYIDNVMAIYRVHPGGVWSTRDRGDRIQRKIQDMHILRENLDPKYREVILAQIFNLHMQLLSFSLARQRLQAAKASLNWCLKNSQYINNHSTKELLKLTCRVYFPLVYNLLSKIKKF